MLGRVRADAAKSAVYTLITTIQLGTTWVQMRYTMVKRMMMMAKERDKRSSDEHHLPNRQTVSVRPAEGSWHESRLPLMEMAKRAMCEKMKDAVPSSTSATTTTCIN